MIKTGTLLTVAQTAHYLGQTLGLGRQWVDTLNDHRQGRGDLKGETLPPIGRDCGTPRYIPGELAKFILRVRDAYGCERPFHTPIQTYTYNDAAVGVNDAAWQYQVLTPISASALPCSLIEDKEAKPTKS